MILLVQRILLAVLGAAMLQSMPSKLEMSMIMAVLQSTPSTLEICACIAVVDGGEAKHIQQIVNAATILFLALCDWHVPRVFPYHNLICRFLSAFCMQALFPYSTTLSCLAILKPTFGKRPHNTFTPTPESQVCASEHASTSADDKISLDEVITKFKATADEDIRAREILAAATTLRDSTGRDRKDALRTMANAWGVTVNEKVADKYKPRPNAALEKDIRASVCQAALDWESGMERDAEPLRKQTKTTGAAGHGASVAAHPRGTIVQLPETPHDVMPNTLSRLGPNMYQGTLRSGAIWRGDAELLKLLPQGEARLATLQTRELVAQAKTKMKAKAKSEEEPPRDKDEPAESSASRRGGGEHGEADAPDRGGVAEQRGAHRKRQRTLGQMFSSGGSTQVEGEHGQAGASTHGGGERVESDVAEHCDGIAADEHPSTTSTELFVNDREEDKVLLDWLRERPGHPRCSVLLRQIMEWTGKCKQAELRSLARAQGIPVKRQEHANVQKLREAVRRHFKAAVGQEKGRLACFQLKTARGASGHSHSLAREAEHDLNAAEVVDLRTILLFL